MMGKEIAKMFKKYMEMNQNLDLFIKKHGEDKNARKMLDSILVFVVASIIRGEVNIPNTIIKINGIKILEGTPTKREPSGKMRQICFHLSQINEEG